jgi:ankyrin repeat protein
MIELLLTVDNTDVNCGTYSTPPLHCAVRSKNLEIVKLLANAGADTGIRDNHQRSPLYIVSPHARYDKKCREIAEFLGNPHPDVAPGDDGSAG